MHDKFSEKEMDKYIDSYFPPEEVRRGRWVRFIRTATTVLSVVALILAAILCATILIGG